VPRLALSLLKGFSLQLHAVAAAMATACSLVRKIERVTFNFGLAIDDGLADSFGQ
jgi:hypothetical protein